jgi:hypothetical protein
VPINGFTESMGDCGAWLQAVNKAIIPVHKQEESV